MAKRKLVIFDVHGDDKRYFTRAFKNVFEIELTFTAEPLNEVTASKYSSAELVSVFVTSKVDAAVLKQLPNLELIACRSTGYDHIDVGSALKQQVLVSTVPSYGAVTVAEFAFMLMLALSRRLFESRAQVEDGVIDHPGLVGFDLCGKTLGIVGCGQIGQHVAKLAAGFDMQVIGHDAYPRPGGAIGYTTLSELLAESDIISLHLPATKETRHLINRRTLSQMKAGVILINTARGELVDTAALIDALYSGQVGAAGLDVVEGEPLLQFEEEISLLHPGSSRRDLLLDAEHNILRRLPNVILTPHNAFNSREAVVRIQEVSAANITSYLLHQPQNLISS